MADSAKSSSEVTHVSKPLPLYLEWTVPELPTSQYPTTPAPSVESSQMWNESSSVQKASEPADDA
ncbi:hypothetical protein ACWD3I_03070 [Streptomyces sp. NPDC002817]|uniref:hypothetical protein n=1 Tax=Streptomyces sp. NPDC088357 TaxID=3154655 RepID=UPI003445FAF2